MVITFDLDTDRVLGMSSRKRKEAPQNLRRIKLKCSRYGIEEMVTLGQPLQVIGGCGSRPFMLNLLKEPTSSAEGRALRRQVGITDYSKARLQDQLLPLLQLCLEHGLVDASYAVQQPPAIPLPPALPSAPPPPAPPAPPAPPDAAPVTLLQRLLSRDVPVPTAALLCPPSALSPTSALPPPTAALLSQPEQKKRKKKDHVNSITQQRKVANGLAADLGEALRGVLEKHNLVLGDNFLIVNGGYRVRLGDTHLRWWFLDMADDSAHIAAAPEELAVPPPVAPLSPDTFARPSEYLEAKEVGAEINMLDALVALRAELFLSHVQYKRMRIVMQELTGVWLTPITAVAADEQAQNAANKARYDVQATRGVGGFEGDLELFLGIYIGRLLRDHPKLLAKAQGADGSAITVLVSGDGAVMTRKNGEVAVTIKLLDLGPEANLLHNIHTVVLLGAKENYAVLSIALRRFFASVDRLKSSHVILESPELRGHFPPALCRLVSEYAHSTAKVHFKMCADMKFQAITLGFGSAVAEDACYLCTLPKECYSCTTSLHKACHANTHRNTNPLDLCAITQDLDRVRAICDSKTPPVRAPLLAPPSLEAGPQHPGCPVPGCRLSCSVQVAAAAAEECARDDSAAALESEQRVLSFLTLKAYLKGSFKKGDLVTMCKAADLAVTGTIDQLTDRFCQHKEPLLPEDIRLKAALQAKISHYGYIRRPIVRGISLHDVILDVLHLRLRVGDRLLKLFFTTRVLGKNNRQVDLLAEMTRLKVHFEFRATKDPAAGDGVTAWTSLQGDDMSKVLSGLSINNVIANPTLAKPVQAVWDEFVNLSKVVETWSPTHPMPLATLQDKLLAWQEQLRKLYGQDAMTPYVHMFVAHSVQMVRRHGGLGQYSCQSAEKLNNMHQKAYFRCTPRGGGRGPVETRTAEYHVYYRDLRWRDYVETHPGKPKFHCGLCSRAYTRWGDFVNHAHSVHGDLPTTGKDEFKKEGRYY